MKEDTAIGHLTVAKNLDLVHLKAHATIGRANWITGFPLSQRQSGSDSQHFSSEIDRRPELVMGEHSAITIGIFSIARTRSQLARSPPWRDSSPSSISHTIDIKENRQTSRPISIGDYCFVGSNSVLLSGAALPNYCVLGAKSLLNKAYTQTHRLYGGVPARELSALSPDCGYFNRRRGYVI
jgi:acetyltransferase-like isoleucine patch superfamily enzyme